MSNDISTQDLTQISRKKQGRNSLLELYRFLFALWVVYYHGFFVTKGACFNHGYISVEFFFILSGFFLISSFKKLDNIPIHIALFKLICGRIKSLGVAFPISLVFVVWYMILDRELSFFGYMWYIPFMLLAFAIFFFLYRLIKKQYLFIITLLTIIGISYIVLYLPIIEGFGLCRALGGVSIGIIISYIPKFNLRIKCFDLNYIFIAAIFTLVLYLAYLPKENLISEYFLVLLLLPLLIYLTATIKINSKILNFLGSMSFGLYAYQCILRVFEFYITTEIYVMFIILVLITLTDRIISHFIKANKIKGKI